MWFLIIVRLKSSQVRPTDRVAWILISALGSIIVITLDVLFLHLSKIDGMNFHFLLLLEKFICRFRLLLVKTGTTEKLKLTYLLLRQGSNHLVFHNDNPQVSRRFGWYHEYQLGTKFRSLIIDIRQISWRNGLDVKQKPDELAHCYWDPGQSQQYFSNYS